MTHGFKKREEGGKSDGKILGGRQKSARRPTVESVGGRVQSHRHYCPIVAEGDEISPVRAVEGWKGGRVKNQKPQSHSALWLESMRSLSSRDSNDCTAENWLQAKKVEEEEENLAQLSLTTHRL